MKMLKKAFVTMLLLAVTLVVTACPASGDVSPFNAGGQGNGPDLNDGGSDGDTTGNPW